MSETVLLAIIGGVVTVLTAIIGKISIDVGRTKKDAKSAADDAREARIQVKNSHTTNLREEGDERHAELVEKITELGKDVAGLRQDHQDTTKNVGLIHGALRGLRKDITGLRDADEQARTELTNAVTERHREINRLRAEIPEIIRRETNKDQ